MFIFFSGIKNGNKGWLILKLKINTSILIYSSHIESISQFITLNLYLSVYSSFFFGCSHYSWFAQLQVINERHLLAKWTFPIKSSFANEQVHFLKIYLKINNVFHCFIDKSFGKKTYAYEMKLYFGIAVRKESSS